jgi:hypothetical protein
MQLASLRHQLKACLELAKERRWQDTQVKFQIEQIDNIKHNKEVILD